MIITVIFSSFLVSLNILIHFFVLRGLYRWQARKEELLSYQSLLLILTIFAAHLFEIGVFAFGYAIAIEVLGLGSFGGLSVTHTYDYLYFSAVTYTSLGIGDVFPISHLRFLAGVEALNGLILLAWSGSFIYIHMSQFWQIENKK